MGSISDSESGNGYYGYFCCTPLLPVDLGVPFLLEVGLKSSNYSNPVFGPSGGIGRANLTLQFLESDRVTPVNIFKTTAPEPAFLALAGLGFVGIALGWKRIGRNLGRPRILG
ncbi:MAG TPA: PEP-CTERM sorting domain-containing protein [Edaphobacter sp.]|nr:PEP-CTERM sorting domain-containing protein [Edaphobacter sp.]